MSRNRPFVRFGQMSLYLWFKIGLGRKHSNAKGFRESLRIDFKFLYLIYFGEQRFCLCNKVFLDGLVSQRGAEK